MSPSDGGAGLDVSPARRLIATGAIPVPGEFEGRRVAGVAARAPG